MCESVLHPFYCFIPRYSIQMHSSSGRPLACSHLLAVRSNAAVDSCGQLFCGHDLTSLGGYLGVNTRSNDQIHVILTYIIKS